MSKISANLKNIFWSQKPPILKLEVGFFSDRKRFSQIFENWQKFFHLNFIFIRKNQRNFFDHKNPQFWNLKSDFFPIKKVFRRFSKIGFFFTWSLFLLKKNQSLFWSGGREVESEVGRELITTASRWLAGEGRRS